MVGTLTEELDQELSDNVVQVLDCHICTSISSALRQTVFPDVATWRMIINK